MSAPAAAILAVAKAQPNQVTILACDCGTDLDINECTTVDDVHELLWHCATAHPTVRQLDMHRSFELFSADELRVVMGLAPA